VAGYACDAIELSLTLACSYGDLDRCIRLLQADREMQLHLDYHRQGRGGKGRRQTSQVPLPAPVLLAAIEQRRLDVIEALVVSWLRPEINRGFSECALGPGEIGNLTSWALIKEDVELVIVPNGAAFMLGIRRGGGGAEDAWRVVSYGTEATLRGIREREAVIIAETRRRRQEAEAFLPAGGDLGDAAGAGPAVRGATATGEPREEEAVL